MSNALQTTPYPPVSTHGDLEGLPLKKKTLLPPVFSSSLSLVLRHPFLSSIIIFMTLTGVVGCAVNLTYTLGKQDLYLQIPPNSNGVAIFGDGANFDEDHQALFIPWRILGCGTYRLPTYPSPTGTLETVGCGALDRAVDVHFNHESWTTYSYDPEKFPLDSMGKRQFMRDLTTFTYPHFARDFNTDMAPFDVYSLSILAFVIEKGTNKSVPIIKFTASQAPDNFTISFTEMEMTTSYTYDSETGPTTIPVDSRLVHVEARRSRFARAFTMCFFLVNWTLTVGSIYIVLVVFRRGVDDADLVFPITLVLTIPTLRGLYPGSPPIGIFIDTFGFVLQMMTVAVCSIVLVYCVAILKPVRKRQASRDDGSISLLDWWSE